MDKTIGTCAGTSSGRQRLFLACRHFRKHSTYRSAAARHPVSPERERSSFTCRSHPSDSKSVETSNREETLRVLDSLLGSLDGDAEDNTSRSQSASSGSTNEVEIIQSVSTSEYEQELRPGQTAVSAR